MISGSRQSALIATVPPLAQGLGYVCPTETSLARAGGIDLHQHTRSLFRFRCELSDEARPSSIRDRLGEHASRQTFDIQIFNGNHAVTINHLPRFLSMK